MSKIVRVNMTNLKVTTEDSPPEYELLGGRGLSARILNKEVDPTCHPLGKYNKLIFALGLLAGSVFPSTGRISVGAKSPLTLGIKESNVGGTAGDKLGRLDIKAIIIEGQPAEDKLYTLKITKDKVSILPADDLAGLGNYATVEKLMDAHGKDVSILSIGTTGEMKMAMASVACTDTEGRPTRHAGRGGLGAVMGAKGVKAIVIDGAGTKPVEAKNVEALRKAIRDYTKMLNENKAAVLMRENGTLGGLKWISEKNMSLPTRNFTSGSFEEAANIGSKTVTELITSRGGEYGHRCMPGCILRCSNIFLDKEGNFVTGPIEYETAAMLGANLGIGDIDAIAVMTKLCDDYGLDTIEPGVCIGVAADAGLFKFGDCARAIDLLHEIGKGTTLGRVLGQGTAVTARVFGISRVPVVKGQGVPAHEPRVENGTGTTYCTSPQGADHNAGLVYQRAAVPAEAVEKSRERQISICVIDSLGICIMASIESGVTTEMLTEILNAQRGLNLSLEDVQEIGKAVLKEERAFNQKAGFTNAADRLPEFFLEDPLPPSGLVFNVSDSEIDSFWDF